MVPEQLEELSLYFFVVRKTERVRFEIKSGIWFWTSLRCPLYIHVQLSGWINKSRVQIKSLVWIFKFESQDFIKTGISTHTH